MKKIILFLSVIALNVGVSYAGDQAAKGKMDREQMAQLHQQMADCLRSDRDIQECRDQMKQAMRKEKRKGVGATGEQSDKGMGGTSEQSDKGMGSTSDQQKNGMGATGDQQKNGTGATGDHSKHGTGVTSEETQEGASEESSEY